MISFFEATILMLSVHRVGNKSQDEFYVLSEHPVDLKNQQLSNILQSYFLRHFEGVNERYNFYHPNNDLSLNELYHFSSEIFDDAKSFIDGGATFHDKSKDIAKFLYDVATHPKIKSGELYVAYFENVQIDGELLDAIGIFKTENKETYLKVSPSNDAFDLSFEQDAINIDKLDKGCLIFNSDKSNGFKIAVLDRTNKGVEALYWKDEFLRIQIQNNEYSTTSNMINLCRSFIADKLDDHFDMSAADKSDLLNKSLKYFKEKESFDMDEYSNEVINNAGAIDVFKEYKSIYNEDFDANIPDCFNISDAAVKKTGRVLKSVIKLDKNFQIHVHGNKDLIEKGYDDDKGLNFYKVYFREEE
ncbi:nucleoid-associated protein [Pedobacter sp. B4-66]|uniref:nucleoid-associated protein n=1 Tax=Pedobacter sp. B4-66 TaxID=2817280 RepID=UPI001BDB6621|nr:nucleoid-associated protein [Pedobacter sp. B4-66]